MQLHHHNQSFSLQPSRPVYANYELPEAGRDKLDSQEFTDKKAENYQKKLNDLTGKIAALEKDGKTDADIKEMLLQEKKQMVIDSINQTLLDLKIETVDDLGKSVPATYDLLMLDKDPRIARRAANYRDELSAGFEKDVNQAVDDYFKQKGAATKKTQGGLGALPAPTEQVDLKSANEETAKLQEVLSKRNEAKSKAAEELAALSREATQNYHTRMEIADRLTSPEGEDTIIDDYDDGWTGPETDFTASTRMRLNGYLYASDIFYGGSVSGEAAIKEAIQEAVPLYESSTWDHIFKKKDLEDGMALRSYLNEATRYAPAVNNRVIGVIAGLLKFTDRIAIDSKEYPFNRKYKEYLYSQFNKLKTFRDEEKQLEFLYTIRSFPEFIGSDLDWKGSFAQVEDKTNPDRVGDDVIDDYREADEADKDNKDNKVRKTLNGYLYAAYVFGDKDQVAMDNEYQRAHNIYKHDATFGTILNWEHLTRKSNGSEGDEDGFDLKNWLDEAAPYSKFDDVRGFIAGIKKIAFDRLSDPIYSEYNKYLMGIIETLNPSQSRDAQMMTLSRIKSPEKFKEYLTAQEHENLVSMLIEATKQHNQFTPAPGTKEILSLPMEQQNSDLLKAQAAFNKVHLNTFVLTHSNKARNDLDGKFKLLKELNSKLPEPLYNSQELDPLDQDIRSNIDSFFKVETVVKEPDFSGAVYKGYLKDLSEAESVYYSLAEQLDAKLKEVDDQSKAPKEPVQPVVVPVPGPGPSETGPEEENEDDEILSNWKESQNITPELGDYVGPLIVDSSSDTEKVASRNANGGVIKELDNGTEVTRTAEDQKVPAKKVEYLDAYLTYIQVHLDGKAVWLPEQQLYKKEDYEIPAVPATPETPDTIKTPEKNKEVPRYLPSYFDGLFENIKKNIDATPGGIPFDLSYDGMNAGCRVEKISGGFRLNVNHPEAGTFSHTFNSLDQLRDFLETFQLRQNLAVASLQQRSTWERLKNNTWNPEIKKLEKKGPNSFFVELDWHGGGAFETGNAKIDLDVNPDGRIHFLIRAPHVGPNGEDQREGYANDMVQMQEMLVHGKNWSEGYHRLEGSNRFEAEVERERVFSELMSGGTFDRLYPKIGEKYLFNNFASTGYSYMHLNWDGATNIYDRHRATANPILEVKINADNTISWKLTRRTGPDGSWLGLSGQARDINDLGNRVAQVKRNPKESMTTPAQNLVNLGNFGYSLYT